jgi:hypothetical protein
MFLPTNTCLNAIRLLKDELGEDTQIVFQPLVSKSIDYLSVVEQHLPPAFMNNHFKLDMERFKQQLLTEKTEFPYKKDIRS